VRVETRSIGSLTVSVVGIGCNNFGTRIDEAATKAVVDAALDAGITLFDTADVYGGTKSEAFLGRALGARRDDVVVATKFGMPTPDGGAGAAPEYVRSACEASLARLGTDRVDLYQLHAPDDTVPIADTLGALDELRRSGKVREVGCSNFTAAQLDAAAESGVATTFRSVQNQFSLLWRAPEDDGVLAACDRLGAGFLPYYPLANGLLSGKVHRGSPPPAGTRLANAPEERKTFWLSDEQLDRVEAIRAIGEAHDLSMLTLAFSWLLARREVASVIAGATRPEQVQANADAPTTLGSDVLAALDALDAES
jgi:aryl-alcohol dehydrogenase-like predicted oxidoreductase